MGVNFALRATYHVNRGDPGDACDDVVECLLLEQLIDSPSGLTFSDLTCSLEEEVFDYLVAPEAQINQLPTGIHTVWAVGTATFHASRSFNPDDDGEWQFKLAIEQWAPAGLTEILEAEAASGADLSEFKLKEEDFRWPT